MQDTFYGLADHATGKLSGDEVLNLTYNSEDSDFVRLNRSRIRQAGHVAQAHLGLQLIQGSRHATAVSALTGDAEEDRRRVDGLLTDLREKIPNLPEDPHLLYATEVRSTEQVGENRLPESREAVGWILQAGKGRDLVGIYASGGIHAGFANSFGQRNWYASFSYNLNWSCYHEKDKAVKSRFGGYEWDAEAFARKVASADEQLTVLAQEPKTIEPGRYRVYLSPAALASFVGMLGWGGFGLKSHRTKQTVLLRMIEGDARLDPRVTISENTRDGVSPNFDGNGFLKPDRVVLIEGGAHENCLVSPRSAKEYDVPTTGSHPMEVPESLDMAAGDLPQEEVLSRLGTGLFINDLWYLNFSDRPACRITGMTRFATFWVEDGKIAAPLNVMRFDETMYRALGENLVGLTKEREMLIDSGTYGGRSTESSRLPGALVKDFNFNL